MKEKQQHFNAKFVPKTFHIASVHELCHAALIYRIRVIATPS